MPQDKKKPIIYKDQKAVQDNTRTNKPVIDLNFAITPEQKKLAAKNKRQAQIDMQIDHPEFYTNPNFLDKKAIKPYNIEDYKKYDIKEPGLQTSIDPIDLVGTGLYKGIVKSGVKAVYPTMEKALLKTQDLAGKVVTSKPVNKIVDKINAIEKAEQKVQQGSDYIDNWYNNPIINERYNNFRNKGITDSYKSEKAGDIINLIKGSNKPRYQEILSNPKSDIKLSLDYKQLERKPLSTQGISYDYGDTFVNKLAPYKATVAAHERTHQYFPGFTYNDAETKFLRSPFKFGNSKYERYLNKPQELHARINEARFQLGLKPEDKVTLEMLKTLKHKSPGMKKMFNSVVDEQALLNVFNNFYTPAAIIGTGYTINNNMKDKKEFQNGGQLGSTLGSIAGMAIGSIIAPGVGTSIGGMLGAKAGNFVSNQFEMGGKLTEYQGNSHSNGGIPIGNKEVEGGESNYQGYIFSDTLKLGKNTFADMSKKINNKYSKRPDDKLSKDSKQRELGNLMKVQESTGMTNQGNKFEGGGIFKTPSIPMEEYNKYSGLTPISPKGVTPITTSPVDLKLSDNTKVVPDVPLTNDPVGNTPLKTEVNPLGYIASNVGPAFDLLQGLKGGDEVNFQRVKPTYANPKEAITTLDNTARTSFNSAKNAIRNNATSGAEVMGFMNSLAGKETIARGLGKAQIKSEYDKINTGIANQISTQNASIQMAESTARQQETDAARSTMSQGLHNFGQNTLGYQADLEANKTQNKMFPFMSDRFDLVEDADGNISFKRKTIKKSNSKNNITPAPDSK